MKDETESLNERVGWYVELFKKVSEEVGDGPRALGLIEQAGKDERVRLMNTTTVRSGQPSGDRLASGKQLNFLKVLGVVAPEGLSSKQASELIDQAQKNAAA